MQIARTEAPVCACGEHAWITLTRGGVALIDPEDAAKIAGRYWYQSSGGYAETSNKKAPGPQVLMMHRVITEARDGSEVDHKTGDRTDNRKHNLRVCSVAQNQWNSGIPSNNTSGAKGVSWSARQGKWRAKIQILGRHIGLGSFSNFRDAVDAYDLAARRYRGQFYRPSGENGSAG